MHATTVHGRGDTRIAVKEATTAQAMFGDVALFVQDGKGDGRGDGGFRIVDTGPPPRGRRRRMTLGMWRMARAVARERPLMVHLHDPELILSGLWWKLLGIKVIYDTHEDLPRQVMSKPYLPHPLRRPLAFLTAWVERAAGTIFDGIVTAIPSAAHRFPADRTALVQNFPDLNEMTFTAALPQNERPHYVVYVGGITEIRGISTMVDAMARVCCPEARLLLAGNFQSPKLECEIAARLGWERVNFLGWADRADVVRLLGQARAGLVLLHDVPNYLEAQPVKMFEYMAAGLPVIASAIPYWRSLLDEFDCAFFVDPEDPSAVAAAIDRVLNNPEEAQEMGARGQRAVRNRFNWAREAEALISLYRQIGVGEKRA